jgi:hypothetical protein
MYNQLIINYHIKKEQEKQYLKIYFDVPSDVEAMTISYSYEGDKQSIFPINEKNVIDLALLDNYGDEIGASGAAVNKITISESYSSPGYKKTTINEGKWCIICGAYIIKKDDLIVNYTIDFNFKSFRYLKGDLHLHSVNSDGKLTIFELGKMARKKGLDFIMITDHNNFAHNKHLPEVPDLSIIPGVEFTHYKGHMNFIGVETPYSGSYAVNDFNEFKALNKEAHDNNAIISINHPFCSFCPWLFGYDDFFFDAVEIWNGLMRQDNLKAVDWWQKELCKGKKITIIGGSDYHFTYFHFINIFSKPTTRIYCQSNTKKDILNAIKSGRCVITNNAKSSMIYMTSDNNVLGDTVKLKDNTTVNIKVDKLKRKHTLFVYDKSGVIFSYKAKKTAPYEIKLPVINKGFIRAEIRCKAKGIEKILDKIITITKHKEDKKKKVPLFIYTITNPIYYD